MATSPRRFGRLVLMSCKKGQRRSNQRGFSATTSTTDENSLQQSGTKSINLFSAINQALHIALETDPRELNFV
ncbi:unnamed protein product [Ilex paraguariensis]|uniref:Uncharacterized protein n=1 Tax=Ilex paraguariensis TaxID=185542 RepID=A0ABC8REX8_9AQUA